MAVNQMCCMRLARNPQHTARTALIALSPIPFWHYNEPVILRARSPISLCACVRHALHNISLAPRTTAFFRLARTMSTQLKVSAVDAF